MSLIYENKLKHKNIDATNLHVQNKLRRTNDNGTLYVTCYDLR